MTCFKRAGNDSIGFHAWAFHHTKPWARIFDHATPEQLATLLKLTERYCVIFQTLKAPPASFSRERHPTLENIPWQPQPAPSASATIFTPALPSSSFDPV